MPGTLEGLGLGAAEVTLSSKKESYDHNVMMAHYGSHNDRIHHPQKLL